MNRPKYPTPGEERQLAIKGPLFSCAFQGCAEQYSFPPDDLAWYEGGSTSDGGHYPAGWYCSECTSECNMNDKLGESLSDFLAGNPIIVKPRSR